MSGAIGDARGGDLNKASEDELGRVGGLGKERVQRLIQNRRYRGWDDLRRVERFGGTLGDDLKNTGATIG